MNIWAGPWKTGLNDQYKIKESGPWKIGFN